MLDRMQPPLVEKVEKVELPVVCETFYNNCPQDKIPFYLLGDEYKFEFTYDQITQQVCVYNDSNVQALYAYNGIAKTNRETQFFNCPTLSNTIYLDPKTYMYFGTRDGAEDPTFNCASNGDYVTIFNFQLKVEIPNQPILYNFNLNNVNLQGMGNQYDKGLNTVQIQGNYEILQG